MNKLKTTRQLLVATAVAAALLAATSSTRAQPIPSSTSNWMGETSSNWFTGGNWSNNVPTNTAFANIDSTAPSGVGAVVAAPGATAHSITVGNISTGMLTIQSGGMLTVGAVVGPPVGGTNGLLAVGGGNSAGTGTGTLTIEDG